MISFQPCSRAPNQYKAIFFPSSACSTELLYMIFLPKGDSTESRSKQQLDFLTWQQDKFSLKKERATPNTHVSLQDLLH
jgi:hypothetical protein